MPLTYVYSPISGQNWGSSNYCTGGQVHPVVGSGSSLPIDIGVSMGYTQGFNAYMGPSVASIFIGQGSGMCVPSAGATAPWQNRIRVKLYSGFNNTGVYIGDVLYGHANYAGYVAGVFNRPGNTVWGVTLGTTCPDTCNCNAGGCCYCGVHIHMEGRAQTGSFSRTSIGCNGWLYDGSTVVYVFSW